MTFDEKRAAEIAAVNAETRKLAVAFREVLGLESARSDNQKVVWAELKHFCFVDRTTATDGSSDAVKYHEGRRQVALRIAALLEISVT